MELSMNKNTISKINKNQKKSLQIGLKKISFLKKCDR